MSNVVELPNATIREDRVLESRLMSQRSHLIELNDVLSTLLTLASRLNNDQEPQARGLPARPLASD